MKNPQRPRIDVNEFDRAMENVELEKVEFQIIDYIRFIGVFSQPILKQALNLESKPPALSILCVACRKIGAYMPDHFEKVRDWSKLVSIDGVRWDGDLICSTTLNIDGQRLTPEAGTSQFHNFAVHRELFVGF